MLKPKQAKNSVKSYDFINSKPQNIFHVNFFLTTGWVILTIIYYNNLQNDNFEYYASLLLSENSTTSTITYI